MKGDLVHTYREVPDRPPHQRQGEPQLERPGGGSASHERGAVVAADGKGALGADRLAESDRVARRGDAADPEGARQWAVHRTGGEPQGQRGCREAAQPVDSGVEIEPRPPFVGPGTGALLLAAPQGERRDGAV